MDTIFKKIKFSPVQGQNKSWQLAQAIRNSILSGKLKPGQRLPVSREIAKELSLGLQTVQKAFEYLIDEDLVIRRPKNGSFVADNTFKGIKKISKNYQIAWIVFNTPSDSPSLPSLSLYLEPMNELAQKYNCNLHIISIDPGEIEHYSNSIFRSAVMRKQIDAAIIRAEVPNAFKDMLRDYDIPFICQDYVSDASEPSVSNDPIAKINMAIEYLINLKHRRIGFVVTEFDYQIYGPNYESTCFWLGYCQALSNNNIPVSAELVKTVPGWLEGTSDSYAQAMLQLMNLPDPPTAIYVCSEHGAQQGIELLISDGISVPEKVSVMAPGSGRQIEFLTTVQEDFEAFGRLCGNIILKTLEEGRYPQQKRFIVSSKIVERHSCSANI